MLNAVVPSKAMIHSFYYLFNKKCVKGLHSMPDYFRCGHCEGPEDRKDLCSHRTFFFFFFFRELRQNRKRMRTREKRIRISVVLSTMM